MKQCGCTCKPAAMIWIRKISHTPIGLHCLILSDWVILGGFGDFRRYGLPGGSRLPEAEEVVLMGVLSLPTSCLMLLPVCHDMNSLHYTFQLLWSELPVIAFPITLDSNSLWAKINHALLILLWILLEWPENQLYILPYTTQRFWKEY